MTPGTGELIEGMLCSARHRTRIINDHVCPITQNSLSQIQANKTGAPCDKCIHWRRYEAPASVGFGLVFFMIRVDQGIIGNVGQPLALSGQR